MIGVEQWRASIGLFHSGSCRQQACVPDERGPAPTPHERQLAPIPVCHLLVITVIVLILVGLLVCGIVFVIWILVNGYSFLKWGLTHIMAFKKRTSGTQLLVSVWAIGQAVMEAISGCLERSVRARAILLIMAGDVEQNPGPLPPASSNPESRALRHHSASLITAITDPLMLSWKLLSIGIIDMATKDKANLPTMTTVMKNDVLLSAVMGRVDINPSLFHQFVKLLKDNGDDILKSLGRKLEDTYNEFTRGGARKYTLSLQSEISSSHIGTQPSQPHPPSSPSHLQPSLLCYPSTNPPDSYNTASFQMHLPPSHAQPLVLHHYPSQPLTYSLSPYPLSQSHTASYHPSTPFLDSSKSFPMHSHPSQPPLPPHSKQIKHSPPPMKCSPNPLSHSLPQSPFQLFVSYLRSFYSSEVPLLYCKWPPVLKKKFINLAAISRKGVSSKELKQFMLATLHGNVDQILEKKAPIKLEAIFDNKPGEVLHCVLVEGAPGVGKTTLSWEICKRWARGELFQQYRVVMLLRLRDRTVQNAKSIMDLIYYMYNNEDDESDILQYMKQTKGRDILIILEGLDELPKHHLSTEPPSIFTQLLSRKVHVLPDATILITSRPSATVQLQKGWEISRHIEVLGFTDKNITEYIQSTLSPHELPAFDDYLSTYPNIRLTMYIPLNCAIVVEVYRSCQQSSHPTPKTITELYTCLVQTILLRYLDSHPDYKDNTTDIDKFTDLPPPVYQHFYELTHMAYDGIQNQQLTFEDYHRAINHLGFMDTVTELFPARRSVTYSYNFLHLSLQEYLAAYFISLKSTDEQQQLLQTMCTKQHLKNTGRFLAGITKYKGMDKATVKTIIEHECWKYADGPLSLSPFTLQLLHESGNYSIIEGHSSYSCTLTDYSSLLDCAVLGHCIANSSYKWTLELGGGQYMQSTDRIAMLVQTLKGHSNPRPSYTIKRINCYYDAPECVQHLLELPQCALQQIQILWLASNIANPHPLPQWVYELILSKMSRLHSLWLYRGAVSTSGAIAIADIIKNNNTVRYVNLTRNNISEEGVKAWEKIREIRKDLELDIYQ